MAQNPAEFAPLYTQIFSITIPMRLFGFLFILLILFFPPQNISAQLASNGTVYHQYYVGAQPNLVSNVSSLPATGNPLIRHVWLADKNIVVITIDERTVIHSNLKPYEPKTGDSILHEGYHGYTKILKRGGQRIGYICGRENEWFRNFNAIAGEKLDTSTIAQHGKITVSSGTDQSFASALSSINIYRKTYPINKTHMSLRQSYPLRHDIFLEFDRDFINGNSYTIHLDHCPQLPDSVTFTFEVDKLRSEAIHVNLLGFAPADKKSAFMSVWMGDGGSCHYEDPFDFKVIDVYTERQVLSGRTSLKTEGNSPEYLIDGKGHNHNLTDVLVMDISAVKNPGTYCIVAEGIGRSFDFEVDPDTWDNTAFLLMKGFLHQRSGIALGPPFTDYHRPLNMHPDGGLVIHKCDPELFFNPPGELSTRTQKAVFERINASLLWDTEIPRAWGGWMDAGDFDQRMTHLWSVRRMAYLHDLYPEYFEAKDYNIPESINSIPDILDEGSWGLDVFRRT